MPKYRTVNTCSFPANQKVKADAENGFPKITDYLQDTVDVVLTNHPVKLQESEFGDNAYLWKHLKRKLNDLQKH